MANKQRYVQNGNNRSFRYIRSFTFVFFVISIFYIAGCDNSSEDPVVRSNTILSINEFLAFNHKVNYDNDGEFDDWLEIYNPETLAVDISGFRIYDGSTVNEKYIIPEGTLIEAGEFILFWCDLNGSGLHTNFSPAYTGGRIIFEDQAGALVDEIEYNEQIMNVSYGRFPDGSDHWQSFLMPTPAGANIQQSEESYLGVLTGSVQPVEPSPRDTLIFHLNVEYNEQADTVWLWLKVDDNDFRQTFMEISDTGDYHIQAGPFADSTLISYYFQVRDKAGQLVYFPEYGVNNPQSIMVLLDNLILPELFINEILAGNDTTNTDEFDEADAWIELFNRGNSAIDIGGYQLSDDGGGTRFQITASEPVHTTIPAKGYLVLFADLKPSQGVNHINISLNMTGGEVLLYGNDQMENSAIDSKVYGPQLTDISYGRARDGDPIWTNFSPPTPGSSNIGNK